MSDDGAKTDEQADGDAPKPMRDVVFVHGPNERGDGVRVLRKREDAIELGELREAKEGKPIHGDLVKLTQRREHERLFDVETVVKREEVKALAGGHGPPQVASDRYRSGWDAIFGAKPEERDDVN